VRRATAELAAERGLPVLCEKPLSDTWAGCSDIYRAVSSANIKMEVVQNYRYRAPMLAMKALLHSGELGRINYVVSRFGDDCREYDSWQRRHELPHAMLMDGAAHHFDMLRNLTGGDCDQMAALEWNPPWSSSEGEFNALCLMRMSNGTRATYEGNAVAAGVDGLEHCSWVGPGDSTAYEPELAQLFLGLEPVAALDLDGRRAERERRDRKAAELTLTRVRDLARLVQALPPAGQRFNLGGLLARLPALPAPQGASTTSKMRRWPATIAGKRPV